MKTLFKNSAIVCIIVVSSFAVWLAGNLGAFGINKIVFDVVSYHSYLPAVFIEKDIDLGFYKDSSAAYDQKEMYFANFTKEGKPVIKTTYGLSLMYLPFTVWPLLFSAHETSTGYELPFSIAISISTLVYFILGLWFVYLVLKELRLSLHAIGLSILCLGLGTNLLSYASISIGMPHAYGFFLTSVLIYLTMRWHKNPSYTSTLCIGFVLGLLVLIRPTNSVYVLVFVLYSLKSMSSLRSMILQYWKHFVIIGLVSFCVVLPQLLYWKHVTGHYIYNSYVGERFYFGRPHVLEYLFGFRKGWLVYSPLILFGLIGLFLNKETNPFFKATCIILPIVIYLNSSWWCWWFGGSYGARAMIETYPLLAIGFAAFFDFMLVKVRRVVLVATSVLILFNIKSVDLYRANIIHYDSMTAKAFTYTTFKLFFSKEDKDYLQNLYLKPDYEKAKRGEDT